MVADNAGNKVVVTIYGEDYPVTGVEDPAYISRVADIVDSRMKEIAADSKVKSRDKVAILAAMSMASELSEKAERLSHSSDNMDHEVNRIISRLDEALGNLPKSAVNPQ